MVLTSIPCPLSVICNNFNPPSLTTTSSDVDPASTAFSINSFSACTGATMISPAAILLTTSCASALMRRGAGSGRLSSPFRFVPRGDEGGSIIFSVLIVWFVFGPWDAATVGEGCDVTQREEGWGRVARAHVVALSLRERRVWCCVTQRIRTERRKAFLLLRLDIATSQLLE